MSPATGSFASHDPTRPLNSQSSRPASPPYTPKFEMDAPPPVPAAAASAADADAPNGLVGIGLDVRGAGLGSSSSSDMAEAASRRTLSRSPGASSAPGTGGGRDYKESFIAPSPPPPAPSSASSSLASNAGPLARSVGGASSSATASAASYHPLSNPQQQQHQQDRDAAGPEPKSFWDSEAYWLGLYFFFNLGLTLFNKIVLVSFPFPYTLTGLHALSGCAGSYIALERGNFTPAHLAPADNLKLALFSVLYTINIAVSNLSLQLVTVPFHQVVRAATPLFTIFIATIFLKQQFSMHKLGSLLPVIAGVGFATYGDYYFTAWGLILTLLGTFLAALKTVMTNVIQTGGGGRLKLHPLDLLMRMSPLAFIQCVVYGWWSGELERVRKYGALEMDRTKAIALVVNGVIAFGLNVVSFTANKKTSALTMTVAANVKQVLTIVLAVIIFDLTITPVNGLGIMLTLLGGAGYAYIEFAEKQKKTRRLTEKN